MTGSGDGVPFGAPSCRPHVLVSPASVAVVGAVGCHGRGGHGAAGKIRGERGVGEGRPGLGKSEEVWGGILSSAATRGRGPANVAVAAAVAAGESPAGLGPRGATCYHQRRHSGVVAGHRSIAGAPPRAVPARCPAPGPARSPARRGAPSHRFLYSSLYSLSFSIPLILLVICFPNILSHFFFFIPSFYLLHPRYPHEVRRITNCIASAI